jgi:type VI secretion system protein ImpG
MEGLYRYYNQELEFFRQMAGEFAARYPKVAARLQLDKDGSADPHVERLIEASAILAGRIQHKIDDEFPEVTESLLDVLYPHFLRPVPSLAITQFAPAPGQSKPEMTLVEAGTQLYSRPAGGAKCTFRTCYPVEMWPLEVGAAQVTGPGGLPPGLRGRAASVIRVQLDSFGGLPIGKLNLNRLRFYLRGKPATTYALYELLLNNTLQVIVRGRQGRAAPAQMSLPPESLTPVGLANSEGAIPYSDRSFAGYRLLQEYFCFPEKFLFVDLSGLEGLARQDFGPSVDLLFCLGPIEPPERLASLEQAIDAQSFQLGCTPAINLFDRVAEPLRLTHTRFEYRVVPDQHRQTSTEVYSINKVTSTAPYLQEVQTYEPFYSFRHANAEADGQRFWFARRRPSFRKNDPGSEVYLSLVDLNFQPALPPVEMLTVHITCTNRDLPGNLQWSNNWGEMSAEGKALVQVRFVRTPTPAVRPPLRRGLQWRLISHLALNHLSVVQEGLPALREILKLYDFSTGDEKRAIERQVNGITGLASRPAMSRVVSEIGVVFCRGLDVELEFDEDQFAGAGVFLFASVLERFLGLYTALNSFSRLTVRTRQRKGVLKQWPPLAGEQRIL